MSNRILASILLAGGASVVAMPVLAADSLVICEPGQPYLWPDGGANIPFNPDQGDLSSGAINNVDGVALVQEAFDNWTASGPYSVPTSATYSNAGPLPVDVDFSNYADYLESPAEDGFSAIVFDATGEIFDFLYGAGSGILGFASPEWGDPATCEITEGYSFLNGPAFSDLQYAEDVMTHEFGHYSNIGHVELNGQVVNWAEGNDDGGPTPDNSTFPLPPTLEGFIETMYPIYFGTTAGTESPHADDVASLAALYPGATYADDTGSISGTIYAADGETRLSGVNVIARNLANPWEDAVSTFSGTFTDNTDQSDPFVGTFTLGNLTPGAEYAVFVDEVTAQAGRFSNPILTTLPGPEEFWNEDEASTNPPDDVTVYTPIMATAGVAETGIDVIFNQPSPGDPLPVGLDGFVELPLPFDFGFCGETYRSVFVQANGNLTLGAPDTSFLNFAPSVASFLGDSPRIAPFWDDYNVGAGGIVTFDYGKNWLTVIWEGVPEYVSTGSNTFSVTLKRANNGIVFDYGEMSSVDGLAGVSCGGAVTSGYETETDLSALTGMTINLNNAPAVFEFFEDDDGDLSGTMLKFNGTTNYNDNWAEKNDTPNKARSLNLPFSSADVTRFTEIEPTGADIDWYRFQTEGLNSLDVNIASGQLDSLIGLFDGATGALIAQDDDGGSGLLSRISAIGLPAGTYYLAVTTYPDLGLTGEGGSGGRYVLEIAESNAISVSLGDDDSVEIPLGFSFPFNGASYGSVFVNSNGSLTFGGGDTDFSESVSEFLAELPRIAPLWDDLSPNNAGSVSVELGSGEMTVIFDSVPEFISTGANTFMVTLRDDGSFTIEYGAVSATDGLAGVTEGGGVADPGETDLSAAGALSASGTTYELFTGDQDLSGIVLDFNP
ncbi:hypothetical protein [Marinihelvus fidelis]|nr:hypothetical protein [Marinihelvus fidelis]